MKKCLLFASLDTEFLNEYAISSISRNFDLQMNWRLNRKSPGINNLREEIENFEDIDYVFNFLSPKLFPNWLIQFPKIGCINFHPASQDYPGVGGASYSLFDNQSKYGVTAHFMTEKIDEGDIIAQRFFNQREYNNCKDLFMRALQECCYLLDDTLDLLKVNSRPGAINTWKRSAISRKEFIEWMTIDIDTPKEQILRKIAAIRHPDFPGPYIRINGFTFSLVQVS